MARFNSVLHRKHFYTEDLQGPTDELDVMGRAPREEEYTLPAEECDIMGIKDAS